MRSTPGSDVPLPRGYRLRVIAFVLLSVAAVALVYVGWDFLAALRRVEVVEQERDEWQRPDGILRALDLHDGDVVTDLGCGSGYFTLKLSPSVGPRGRVLAVDIRDLPLFVLRVRAWRRGLANISAIKGRSDDPKLGTEGVDAVLVLNTYHELDQASAVLSHLYRALRPGGRIVVVDRGPRFTLSPPQPGEHEVSPSEGETGLRAAGFEVLGRDDRFVDRLGDPDVWWMIIARRPRV